MISSRDKAIRCSCMVVIVAGRTGCGGQFNGPLPLTDLLPPSDHQASNDIFS